MISKIYMTSTRRAQHNTTSTERDIQKWVVGMREGMEHDKRRKRHTKVGGWNEREGMEMESGSPHLFCAIDHGH